MNGTSEPAKSEQCCDALKARIARLESRLDGIEGAIERKVEHEFQAMVDAYSNRNLMDN